MNIRLILNWLLIKPIWFLLYSALCIPYFTTVGIVVSFYWVCDTEKKMTWKEHYDWLQE